MQPYRHQGGKKAGVSHFCIKADSIVLRFEDGSTYLYDYDRPGREQVEAMKKLARAGQGLTTYLNRNVRERYARKLD